MTIDSRRGCLCRAAIGILGALLWTKCFSQSADTFNPSPNGNVYTVAQQADGSILIGGGFSVAGGAMRLGIARFSDDGTLDQAFDPAAQSVETLVIQEDGRILIGGDFLIQSPGGQSRNYLARINPDGTLDASFNPAPDNTVYALAIQPDGKIIVGGSFQTLSGVSNSCIARLNPDGTLDSGYNPVAGPVGLAVAPFIDTIGEQPDGKAVIAGGFTTMNGEPRNCIARLNPDGTLDQQFNPGADADVWCVAVQPDAKIIVGGSFSTLGGQPRNYLGRLNPDGSIDSGFDLNPNGWIWSVVSQADGQVLVGGAFSVIGGQVVGRLVRVDPNGMMLDPTFDAQMEFANIAGALGMQTDGKVLVAGGFDTLAGQPRKNMGRLINTSPATQSLSVQGPTVTWLRGGTSPEVWRTVFDVTTNGTTWARLGEGTRTNGGWQLTGVTIPPNASLRARGFTSGGTGNASTWFVESTIAIPDTRPVILNDSGLGFNSGHFGFNISSPVAQSVVIESSTDLTNWLAIGTNSVPVGLMYFSDPGTQPAKEHFYRLRVVQ